MSAPLKRIVLASAAVAVLAAAAFYVLSHPSARLTADQAPASATRADPALAGSTAILGQAIARLNVPSAYTVRPGDTLTSIAARHYGKPDVWPAIYWANDREIRWADRIETGQVLVIPAEPSRIPAAPPQLAPPAPKPVPVLVAYAAPAQAPVPAPARAAPVQQATAASVGSYPGGAFGACVVERESGGNAQVMNATGHYGLYQFSEATWVEYGGSAADFGNASAAEQEQIFANALTAGGESNWSAYDGC